MVPRAFFAYSSSLPTLREAIQQATQQLNRSRQIEIMTWEECRIGGKIIIDTICDEIDRADLFFADLTGLSANVMFELGYAIAKKKRVWLILDTTYPKEKKLFDQLRILTTVGYESCCNSTDIINGFYQENPTQDLANSIFAQAIEPNLRQTDSVYVLYLKSKHDNEASIRITKDLGKSTCDVITDDPSESTVQSLTGYGTQVFNSKGVLIHLTEPNREGARLQTVRYALVAGMSFGFGKNILMITEGDFLAPIDYRDLLKHYSSSGEAARHLYGWLRPLEEKCKIDQELATRQKDRTHLVSELRNIGFGEHVAENESVALVERYFIPTSSYQAALEGLDTVFIGRKGSGKTANLLKLQDALSDDRRNIVCVLRPAAYEMLSIVELLNRYVRRDTKGHAIESLWKFLIYTEIASVLAKEMGQLPPAALDTTQQAFLGFIKRHEDIIGNEFSVRLERCVQNLLHDTKSEEGEDIETTRVAISEILHSGLLKDLRLILGNTISKGNRVAILIDNLDKAWEKKANLEELSDILFSLLSAAQRIPQEFMRSDSRRRSIQVSIAVFLRSDMFYKIRESVREPDKINFQRLDWHDRELLIRVIEERFIAMHDSALPSDQLWKSYFCKKVRGVSTREYLLDVILARPRDLIFLVNNAVAIAVNRGHTMVEEADIIEAEKLYSQYAFESILAENTLSGINLDDILFEFAGADPILPIDDLKHNLNSAGVVAEQEDSILELLCGLTFLGIEVGKNQFSFSDDPRGFRRDQVRARKYVGKSGNQQRLEIHPAFRAFLEIK